MEQELIAANNRLLEKRKAIQQSTQSTVNAPSKIEIPKCIHGITIGDGCSQCQEYSDLIERERQEERARRNREDDEWKERRRNNPESYMESIPRKFRSSSLEKFEGGETAKQKCREFIEKYVREIRENSMGARIDFGLKGYPGSILFTGPTGCGKTHLAVATYRELVKECKVYEALFITAPELLLEIRATFGPKKAFDSWVESDPNQTEQQVIDKYSQVELLILDDLGSEKTSEFAISSLYLIIDRRNRNLKPTIITTNLSLKEIEEKLDARIASRLSDMTVIKINMPDYRKRR